MLMVGPTSLGCSFDGCCQLSLRLLTSEAVPADGRVRLNLNQHARSDVGAIVD